MSPSRGREAAFQRARNRMGKQRRAAEGAARSLQNHEGNLGFILKAKGSHGMIL